MTDSAAPQAPSTEDIFAQIRRSISGQLAEPGSERRAPDGDILELTDMVVDDEGKEKPADPLMSPQVSAVASSAFARLSEAAAARAQPGGPALAVEGAVTVEAIVRELLKPMLREWLDQHLPAVVERIVEEEVARVTRNASRRS